MEDINDPADYMSEAQTARDAKAREMLGNAYAVKGADFANYASAYFELAQINMIGRKLIRPDTTDAQRAQLARMLEVLVGSIETKLYENLTGTDREEARNLAGEIVKATRSIKGA